MKKLLTRRGLLSAATAGGLGAFLSPFASAEQRSTTMKRSIRLAHLTDIHIMAEGPSRKGFAKCLEAINGLKDKPDLMLCGGDMIMDSWEVDASATKKQWDAFAKTLVDHNDLAIRSAIGNHDHWQGPGSDGNVREGKKWAMERLHLANRPYYSFNQAGWHFIVLDSTMPGTRGYTARLDDEQFEWLEEDLKRTPSKTPILVLSHIPIISACAFFHGSNERTGNWRVPGAWVHLDARKIKDLFKKYPNVKVCISGHIHLVDRVDYCGVTYLCNGAVCGGWWKGAFQECHPGYTIIDLYPNGTFTNSYKKWGWSADLA